MLGNQGHLTRKASGFPVQYINISLDLQEKDLCLKAKLEMKTWKFSKAQEKGEWKTLHVSNQVPACHPINGEKQKCASLKSYMMNS